MSEKFEDLLGVTLKSVVRESNERIVFTEESGKVWYMYHSQDCCESVTIDDIAGDLNDLVGTPIIRAEENSWNKNPEGVKVPEYQDSFTWTFYRIGTAKGTVVIRWYGESNGYYSESVDFGSGARA